MYNTRSSRDSYLASPYRSIKHSTYFETYDYLFANYVTKPIVFVEVGVLGGGSLFMWRDFLGPQARIIGIDLNPAARRWEDHGFEIFIGDQSDPEFWKAFFETVGEVDVILDDGGHTYFQQLQTFASCVGHIRDGGLLVVEDTHTSYMRGFGRQKYSFVEFSKRLVDKQNLRFGAFAETGDVRIWSIQYFESFVVFHVHRAKQTAKSFSTENKGAALPTADFRYKQSGALALIELIQIKFQLDRSELGAKLIHTLQVMASYFGQGGASLRKLFRDQVGQ